MCLFKKKNKIKTEIFERKPKKDEPLNEEELLKQFDILNTYLEQYISSIKIDVCRGTIDQYYKIKGYFLSFVNKNLSLNLELIVKSEEKFKYVTKFKNINNIAYNMVDNELKVWVYMDKDSARFYLNDISPLVEIGCSNTENYQRELEKYEYFRNSNPLKYHYEKFMDDHKNQVVIEKEYQFEDGSSYYLFMTKRENSDSGNISLVIEDGVYDSVIFRVIDEFIYIVDIVHTLYNKGIGTNAILMLVEYAKKIGINEIKGELSNVDDNHKDRRNHFYVKLGFEFKSNNICLVINKNSQL